MLHCTKASWLVIRKLEIIKRKEQNNMACKPLPNSLTRTSEKAKCENKAKSFTCPIYIVLPVSFVDSLKPGTFQNTLIKT